MKNNEELVNRLIESGYLKTPEIINAFLAIDRKDFVLPEYQDYAYENYPLSINYNQTISQPATVAFMLELLQSKSGQKILDIGAGSGWQTALLASIVGEKGKVFAIERIPEIAKFGKNNVEKYNFIKKKIVEFICGDGSQGLPDIEPFDRFDRIIVAAESQTQTSEILKKQLKQDGRLVLPIQHSIFLITKNSKQEFPGFIFVPLIKF